MGSMQYLLGSGQWLNDGKLYDGASIRLFETSAEADAFGEQFPADQQPHGVQFFIDAHGKVLTARAAQVKTRASGKMKTH